MSDPVVAVAEWGWLLAQLGWESDVDPAKGGSWTHADGTYVFMERSAHQLDQSHDRLRPGVNHIALTIDSRAALDGLRVQAEDHGWREMFADRYPHAGGTAHTALYLENSESFEVEIVCEATVSPASAEGV